MKDLKTSVEKIEQATIDQKSKVNLFTYFKNKQKANKAKKNHIKACKAYRRKYMRDLKAYAKEIKMTYTRIISYKEICKKDIEYFETLKAKHIASNLSDSKYIEKRINKCDLHIARLKRALVYLKY